MSRPVTRPPGVTAAASRRARVAATAADVRHPVAGPGAAEDRDAGVTPAAPPAERDMSDGLVQADPPEGRVLAIRMVVPVPVEQHDPLWRQLPGG